MVARRLYLALMVLSVVMGIYFYGISVQNFDPEFLYYFAMLPFFMFVTGFHGFLAHSLSTLKKSKMVFFPLLMGFLFVFLFFIHLFVIMPLLCPNL
ncbi:hypothetical protein [Rhodonellum sp.]|uniref:hypothetical protein n=1 Tax=Rhodonellum sp. TaxID=2231180 RepID=UPI0027159255|nr:hypothetical protein [Rhodonellum sp.]MDO9551355.1 hypothetical protein [Rhodonellum sp.]